MIRLRVTKVDTKSARRSLSDKVKKIRREHKAIIKEIGDPVKKEVKSLAPFKSGALRKSIRSSNRFIKGAQVYRVFTRKHYGRFQEYGTSKNPPQPFMRPALSKSRKRQSRTKYKSLLRLRIR